MDSLLSIISIFTVLAIKMLILDIVRSRLYLRIDEFGVTRHLCYFFQYDCIVHCFCCVLAPGERSMVLAENGRRVDRIDASLFEGLDNHNSGVFLICLIDLLGGQISCAGDRSQKIICVGCSVQRDISASLCPCDCFR